MYMYVTLPVRLAGNGFSNEGRLEVYHHGVWGTVCSDLFVEAAAQVACFALGFGYVTKLFNYSRNTVPFVYYAISLGKCSSSVSITFSK